MSQKDIVSFCRGIFDENHPQVLAVVPAVNGVPLPQLVTEFEKAKDYEPAGGYAGIIPKWFNYGPLDKYFLGEYGQNGYWASWELHTSWAVSAVNLAADRWNAGFELRAGTLSGTNSGNRIVRHATVRPLVHSFLMALSIERHSSI
jgi:hypothetical protein